jgi:hypothetical protein
MPERKRKKRNGVGQWRRGFQGDIMVRGNFGVWVKMKDLREQPPKN